MPITQPAVVPSTTAGRVFAFGREAVAWGTDAATVYQEPVDDLTISPQVEIWDDASDAGTSGDIFGQAQTTRYDQITVRLSSRVNGLSAFGAAIMAGPVTYTPTGAGVPYTHGPIGLHPTSNMLNTLTCWDKTSEELAGAAGTKKWNAMTPSSLHWTFAQNAVLQLEAQLWGLWPTNSALPSLSKIGAGATGADPLDGTVMMGDAGTFTIVGSGGSAYTTRILSGDFSITRPIEPCFDSTQHDAWYLKPGKPTFSGNLVVIFEGYGSGTVEQDFRSFSAGGTVSTPNVLKFTDANGNYQQWTSWPWHLVSFSLDHGGQYIKANISFRAMNDKATAYGGTPALTSYAVTVRNNAATVLTAP